MLDDNGNVPIAPSTSTIDRLEAKLQLLLSRHERPRSRGEGGSSASNATSTSAGTSSGVVASGTGTTKTSGIGTVTTSTTAERGTTGSFATTTKGELQGSADIAGSSTRIRELEAQLKLAALELRNTRVLANQNTVSQGELALYQGKFDLPLAKLRGLDEDFASELEGCKLVVKRKQAEVDEAMAKKEHAMALVARNTRLNGRQPGMVAAEDVAQADAQLHSADAHVRVKAVELEEAELQCRKLERWRERVQKIIETSGKTE
jgi:hypothetical protein